MADAPGWEYIQKGEIIRAVTIPYTNIMGNFFYAIIVLMAMLLIYVKTEDYTVTTITGLLIAPTIGVLLPVDTLFVAYFSITIGITSVLYKLFKT